MIEWEAIAKLAKGIADYLKLRRDRKASEKQRTIEHYIEWLRRQRHEETISLIEQLDKELRGKLDEIIRAGKPRPAKEIESILKPIAERLGVIERKVDDVPRRTREALQPDIAALRNAITEHARPTVTPVNEEYEKYESEYRAAVQIAQNRLELIGADIARESQSQELSVAYVSLSLGSLGGEDYRLTRAEDLLDNISRRSRRVLIRGVAGSGKSTLLRWVAVGAAKKIVRTSLWEFDDDTRIHFLSSPLFDRPGADIDGDQFRIASVTPIDWNIAVPFLIPIREAKQGKLPEIEAWPRLTAPAVREPPKGWIANVLSDGRALVMLDGVDETPKAQRATLEKQIRGYVETYPKSLFIVTTRPTAVETEWLASLGFVEAEVTALGPEDRARFVQQWHEALKIELDKLKRSEDTQALADKLKAELRRNPAIGALAQTPLLAAMICALHRDRRSQLPESQAELVEALCHMLLYRRERESNIDLSEFPEAYRDLTYPQRRAILQYLAAYMMEEGLSAIDLKLALQKIARALVGTKGREENEAADVLEGIIERSGMLRKRSEESLDFLHNTFKEYLAAWQFVMDVKHKTLIDHVNDGEWDNVLLFAAANDRDRDCATKLIQGVLPKTKAPSRRVKKVTPAVAEHYRRRLMAVRMLKVAQHIDPQIEKRVKKMEASVFPPRTLFDAQALAASGPGFEGYLKYDASLSTQCKVASVRALRLLGTDAALDVQREYVKEPEWSVAEELAQALNPLKIPAVVATLAEEYAITNRQRTESVRKRITDLSPLSNFREITYLFLESAPVSDLTPLQGLTQLRRLDLTQTAVSDLTPLQGLTQLQTLYLDQTAVSDLTPLQGLTQLQGLDLNQTAVSDLTPLQGLTQLQVLYLNQTAVSDLASLQVLTQLRELYLNQTAVRDLTPLQGLTQLQKLYLTQTTVRDLTPLQGLTQLKWLLLDQTAVSDLTPLAGLTNLVVYEGPPIPGHPRFGVKS